MKKLLTIAVITITCACNNSKKEKQVSNSDTTTVDNSNSETSANSGTSTPATGSATVGYSINDTARSLTASALVQKDKSKLSAGNDFLAILTGNNSNGETITVNFLFTTKPGTYPVVGLGLTKNGEVYGGILGGDPKLTKYKVNLTECTDLGSNNIGGHKWKISGSIDEDVMIDAMSIMKINASHPDNVKVTNFHFSNITFDDNWEELMEGLKKKTQ